MATTLTIAVPAAHRDDGNSLAMVLGYGPPDGLTYREPQWQDAAGNLYAAACLPVSDAFFTAAFAPLERPEWDDTEDGYEVNMAGANRAQALIVLWTPETDAEGNTAPVPQASPDSITAIAGPDGLTALAMMGLTRIPQEDVL